MNTAQEKELFIKAMMNKKKETKEKKKKPLKREIKMRELGLHLVECGLISKDRVKAI